ncbi:hypothetical protein BST61_g6814 [Cercospora zeina]
MDVVMSHSLDGAIIGVFNVHYRDLSHAVRQRGCLLDTSASRGRHHISTCRERAEEAAEKMTDKLNDKLIDEEETREQTFDLLSHIVLSRHSIRRFTSNPVPPSLLTSCLSLAQHAPSNSNIQNWRLHLATDTARDRIVSALSSHATTHGPNIPPIPPKFIHYRSAFGQILYGPRGYNIPRAEKSAHREAQLRNFSFFDAPVVGVITQDQSLGLVDALCVGLYINTLILALTARGLGSCLQISVTGFPEVLREEFRLDDEQDILCGIAIGWPDRRDSINDLHVPREDVGHCVRILEE